MAEASGSQRTAGKMGTFVSVDVNLGGLRRYGDLGKPGNQMLDNETT